MIKNWFSTSPYKQNQNTWLQGYVKSDVEVIEIMRRKLFR